MISLTSDGEVVLAKTFLLWEQAQSTVEEILGQQRLSIPLEYLIQTTALFRQA